MRHIDTHTYVAGAAWRQWVNGETTGASPQLPPITDLGMRDAVMALAAADHDDTDAGVDAALDTMFTDGTDHDRLARVVTGILVANSTAQNVHHIEMLSTLAWFDGQPEAALGLARTSTRLFNGQSTGLVLMVTGALAKGMPAPGATPDPEQTARVARLLVAPAN